MSPSVQASFGLTVYANDGVPEGEVHVHGKRLVCSPDTLKALLTAQAIKDCVDTWRALPFYRRAFYWLVSAW